MLFARAFDEAVIENDREAMLFSVGEAAFVLITQAGVVGLIFGADAIGGKCHGKAVFEGVLGFVADLGELVVIEGRRGVFHNTNLGSGSDNLPS